MYDNRKDDIIKLLKEGKTPQDIAKELGLRVGTIYKIANMKGVCIRKNKEPSTVYYILLDLMNKRLSMANIARKHHITKQRVSNIYRSAVEVDLPIPLRGVVMNMYELRENEIALICNGEYVNRVIFKRHGAFFMPTQDINVLISWTPQEMKETELRVIGKVV